MGCPVRKMSLYSNLPVSNTRLENALGFGFVWVRLVRKVIGGPSRRVAIGQHLLGSRPQLRHQKVCLENMLATEATTSVGPYRLRFLCHLDPL